ncbi:hypothetical protein Bhyg_12211 [Pseudolycoriella hygida]|uniref:Transposable element P transposase-like GTP-binding insertion domain-containing protein n=1 Tax=Pseudolycoriella hygida TaxID=35572 RepID=A0A9Q0S0N0_9DIPT|nr:hypothetical protein Bhyg_12211 [Pseudolycoriella hygida]
MDQLLGCDFGDVKNVVPFFEIDGRKIFVFPDLCHMIKLSRGFMCDEASFLDGSGTTISWKYFVNLNKLQNNLGLHLGNKIRNLKN